MNIQNNEAIQIVDRLKEVYNLNTFTALAAVLGVTKQDIRNWRTRNKPPFDICLRVSNELDIDLNWLLKGHGSMKRNSAKEQSASYQTNSLGALESLIERVETLEHQVSELKKQA